MIAIFSSIHIDPEANLALHRTEIVRKLGDIVHVLVPTNTRIKQHNQKLHPVPCEHSVE